MWTSTLVVVLRLVQTPASIGTPQQFVLLMASFSMLVAFVCIMQELSLRDLVAGIVSVLLAATCMAFRYDWLSCHALASASTYNVRDGDRAWPDMYTWTVQHRVVRPCTQPTTQLPSHRDALPVNEEEL